MPNNKSRKPRQHLAYVQFAFVLAAVVLISAATATGQQSSVKTDTRSPDSATAPQTTTATTPAATSDRDDRYRIGPGDVLDIRVFNKPLLSRESVRVNGNGMIRMPLIEDDIMAACRTEGELSKEIAHRYLKYQRNPQVDVFVKEYQSQPVAVIGAVNQPSQFKLQRRVKLLELIALANGPSLEKAGRSVNVVHNSSSNFACPSTGQVEDDPVKTGLDSYKLRDTLGGDEHSNPYVQPGDIIIIPEADQAFVVGNVFKPTVIPLREPVTVSRAIAMAGGPQEDAKREKIRIVRQEPGGVEKKEIFVDLKAVERHQASDILLQANDIVDVPTNSGKRLLKTFVGAIVPAIGQLPTRVVTVP
jgi:polysaccharide export outer membrane protein